MDQCDVEAYAAVLKLVPESTRKQWEQSLRVMAQPSVKALAQQANGIGEALKNLPSFQANLRIYGDFLRSPSVEWLASVGRLSDEHRFADSFWTLAVDEALGEVTGAVETTVPEPETPDPIARSRFRRALQVEAGQRWAIFLSAIAALVVANVVFSVPPWLTAAWITAAYGIAKPDALGKHPA